ncbi:uncharacterized protein LOC111584426 [Amphiprion ocellaris]|uniref:uncharacterized protein LOC111584426 n=1 Tax=Amphiprion ocellaris TaxID=80972 RepID=UPI0024113392|nr:uncharacterized protein LOC111584426 [Amphiprion ocellaris]XP_054872904.1 uncharacterized protein LOC111584426 [Amphiprion ocellaris]XP_054872905.1 uncharacterized protein LOC111584426 [Amphiprion ocellaris]XP_054872906.1 uncharacterized protein LOC111584426 [Amphiprion ocellaris]
MKLYTEIRDHTAPAADLRRKIDACEAVTGDIIKIIYERLSGIDGDFDAEHERCRLRRLLDHNYAYSIYGSTAAQTNATSHCPSSHLASKRVEAAAELAAKEAEYRIVQEERKHKERIKALEEQHKKELEMERSELEHLQAGKDMEAARARLEAYDREIQMYDVQSVKGEQVSLNPASQPPAPHSSTTVMLSAPTGVAQLAQAVQDSIAMNRLPMPEPTVFSGEPIQFIEWKASFTSLIDQKGISAADKLYYLKKYVSGPARKCLEGTFFRNDEAAYQDAWKKLNQRYGQAFVIQRAFREKLSSWPKIQSKDAEGLRNFADFLHACLLAMPHVKGLEILNDCEENQKLTQKLPDWAAARWNRQVTKALMEGKDFPSFMDFAAFLMQEAEVACNPITSIHALRSSEVRSDKENLKDFKRNKASVFNTKVVHSDQHTSSRAHMGSLCMLCEDAHQLHKCPALMKRSLESRRTYVKDNKLCYGCLKQGHSAKDCRHRLTCDICMKRHPTCLHDDNYIKYVKGERHVSMDSATQNNTVETAAVMSLNVARGEHSGSTSMILPVWVSSVANPYKEKLVYALLDTQSDTTFIDQEVSRELQVDSCPVKLKLTTMMGENAVVNSEKVSGLRVRGYSSATHIPLPAAYTKDYIPANMEHIPTCKTAKRWSHLSPIKDEVPLLLSCEVGLLIGYNCSRALAPRQTILGKNDEPYAVQTELGWSIVCSSAPCLETSLIDSLCHRVAVKEIPPATPMDVIRALESDFKEVSGNDKTVSQEDLIFLDKLEAGIRKNEQGQYEMPLPFKGRPYMPDNRQLAEVRLNHLKRKFCRNERYKEDYVRYMSDIIERGDVEEVQDDGIPGEKWYIPHHGIYHPKKPEKLRVVFDCSAKHKGTSLNEHLLSGPDMINNLTGILVRFRQHPIALMCDIEKMFHQFKVQNKDRNYLHFLWWNNGDLSTQPQEYRMTVHLFGAVSSPGCANYGLKHLAQENRLAYPLGAHFIARDFYVDDGVTSTETVEKGIQLTQEARELCAKGGLRLHKFASNNSIILDNIPASEHATDSTTRNLAFCEKQIERALGIHWNIKIDCFTFNITLKDQPPSRRGILSTVASIYDPLGFVAPYLLSGKRILQEMCHHGTGWDEPVSEHLRPRWEHWRKDLINLEKIQIARCYLPHNFGEVVKRELHHFSDASTAGYGQCTYLRLVNKNGEVHCAFIIGKSRVAPTKVTTIPRLELTAAVVAVAVSDMLKEELVYGDVEEFFWTDSKVVLGYLNNEARRFHTFVANRVQKIRNSTRPEQWFYVSTNENPADNASRGTTVDQLLSSNWLIGPQFLWEREIHPPARETMELPIGDPEVKKVQTLQTVTGKVSLTDRLVKFSSWSQAVSAVARLSRRLLKDKSNAHSSVSERENAALIIIKDLQKQAYQEEIKTLSKENQLPRNKLYHLDVFLDRDGVLKVGGRLRCSNLPSSCKHPTVIPREHHITKLIIAHCHERVKHQGKGFTINEIRSSGYWIPGLSRCVTSYVRQCVVCWKLRRPVEGQKMSDLPRERMEPSPPFTYCGMDCFGPFLTKQGRKEHKRYGLLFTCFYSRAIHVEMVEDLSTDAFINGLRCFIALRGSVREIKCDQGTNFVGAKNELNAALQEVDAERLATFLAKKQCDFVFNAPHASHAGGVWERQIRTVRNVLKSTLSLSPGRLNDASLRTLLYEVAAIVNSRPLTTDNLDDPNSLEPLTPNHLITMKATTALPVPGKFVREDLYGQKRWRQVQYLAEQFWSRWRKEYLHNITTRQRWHTPKRNIRAGDIVMDTDETQPRSVWRLGRVSETVMDKDGLVRRAMIFLGDRNLNKRGERTSKASVVERPVHKLVLQLEAP